MLTISKTLLSIMSLLNDPNPNDPLDAASDSDGDGVSALDEFLADTFPAGSIDIDSNGQYDALTDGLLLLRGIFGLDGDALVSGTLTPDAFYTSGTEILNTTICKSILIKNSF